MSKILIHNKGVSKFVLLEDIETGENWIVTNKEVAFHREIYKRFTLKTGRSFICLGGGRMLVNESKIKCWGFSIDYGKSDALLIKKILEENTNKKIIVKVGKEY